VARLREYAGRAMAAYAVMARIGRVDPHLTLRDALPRDEPGPTSGQPIDPLEDAAAVEAEVRSEPGEIVERLVRMRELWRQTTFYLFDADSWRV
jgi:hypothetical protein